MSDLPRDFASAAAAAAAAHKHVTVHLSARSFPRKSAVGTRADGRTDGRRRSNNRRLRFLLFPSPSGLFSFSSSSSRWPRPAAAPRTERRRPPFPPPSETPTQANGKEGTAPRTLFCCFCRVLISSSGGCSSPETFLALLVCPSLSRSSGLLGGRKPLDYRVIQLCYCQEQHT